MLLNLTMKCLSKKNIDLMNNNRCKNANIINVKSGNSSLKKKGFTLVELVAVMAVIAILAAAFVPKVGNYISEAKKVAVLNEAKNIVTAYESISYKSGTKSEAETTVSKLIDSTTILDKDSIKLIPGGVSVKDCKTILETNSFTVNTDGTLKEINGTAVTK